MKKVLLSAVLAASAGFAAHISATLPAYDAQAALVAAKADIPNWMSYLPDELYVAHVSIPGTHDTATGHEWESSLGKSMSTTQVATIDEQLAGGIRAFDFRPGLKTNSETNEDYLVCAHGTTYLKLTLDEAFKKLSDFLDAHPKVFFVIHLFRGNIYRSGDGSSTEAQRQSYNSLFDKTFNKGDFSKYIIDYTPELKVKDIRGKIVVFRRDRIDFAHIEKGGNLSNWPGDAENWTKDNYVTASNATHPSVKGKIFVTDVSSPKNDATKFETEITSITNLYNYAISQPTPTEAAASGFYRPDWTMIFTSGEYNGSGTKAYLNNAVETNPHLTKLISESTVKGPVGIVFSDWVLADKHTYSNVEYEVKGNDLVTAIIENNFAYADHYRVDEDVMTYPEGTNNWDDSKEYFLRNVKTGKLLSSGGTWGTHAVLGNYGMHVVPVYDKYEDVYTFSTTSGNGNIGLDNAPSFYIDFAPATAFKLLPVDGKDGVYILSYTADGKQMAFTPDPVSGWIDGTEYMLEPKELDATNELLQFELVEVGEYLKALADGLAEGESADLTDYMPGHSVWPNDRNNWTAVTNSYSSLAYEGVDQWNDKDLMMHFHNKSTTSSYSVPRTVWTLDKEFSGMPAGDYTLTFQAAQYNLADAEGFTVKVNGTELKDKIGAAASNSAADALKLFRDNAADYTVSHDFTLAEGEPVALSMTNGEISGKEACLFLDNFRLMYHGKSSGIVNVGAEDGFDADAPADVFSVSGVLLRSGIATDNALEGLAPGIYIIKAGSKVVKVAVK